MCHFLPRKNNIKNTRNRTLCNSFQGNKSAERLSSLSHHSCVFQFCTFFFFFISSSFPPLSPCRHKDRNTFSPVSAVWQKKALSLIKKKKKRQSDTADIFHLKPSLLQPLTFPSPTCQSAYGSVRGGDRSRYFFFFFFTPHLITFGSTSPPTFLFLVVRTWNGWICFFSRSQATASVSRTQDTTESVFTCGTKDGGENQTDGEKKKKITEMSDL